MRHGLFTPLKLFTPLTIYCCTFCCFSTSGSDNWQLYYRKWFCDLMFAKQKHNSIYYFLGLNKKWSENFLGQIWTLSPLPVSYNAGSCFKIFHFPFCIKFSLSEFYFFSFFCRVNDFLISRDKYTNSDLYFISFFFLLLHKF